MREVLKALRPVRARLRRNRLLRGAAAGLAAGLGAAALLQGVSFFVPVPDRVLLAAEITAATAAVTALGNALRPVKNRDAARAADACGLQERAITALEGGEEPIRQLQRRDACTALKGLDVKKIRPGSVKKALYAALGCAVLLGGLLLVPNRQDTAAEAQKALNRTLKEARETIEKAAEEDEDKLSEKDKQEMRKITGDLKRELQESRDAADAMVALDRAEKRLEQFGKQKTAGDAAAAAEKTAGLGESQSGSAAENGSAEAAGSVSAQEENGQEGKATAGNTPAGADMKTLQALTALKAMVNPSARSGTGAAGMSGASGNGGSGNNGSNGTGGSRNGNTAGNGAGEGTTNLEQTGNGGKAGQSAGTKDPRYKEVKYETIYDPERIDREKENVLTEQFRMSDEGGTQLETGPGRGNTSGDVPWGDVVQEYADTEAQAADRENLTVQERQWVNEYFRILTDQQ